MTTSRIPAIIDALVSTLTAALTTTTVIDGPLLRAPDGDYVTVGWTPDGDHPSSSIEFVGASTLAQNEQLDIPCYARSFSGGTDMKTRRNAAFTLLAAAQNALRSDPTLGGAVPQPGWAWVGSVDAPQEQSDAGDAVGITFHVNVITRI